MKKTGALLLALVAVMFWAVPSFAGKKAALSEDDMDQITAAGEPKIIQLDGVTASQGVHITFTDGGSFDLNIAGNSQNSLRALTLNNILGENEVANALNIASLNQSLGNVSQTNTIVQSWGATKDISAVTVAGVSGGAGGAGGGGGTADAVAAAATGVVGKCFASPCTSPASASATASAPGGAGGAGGAAAQGLIAKLTMTADQIVDLRNITATSGDVDVFVSESPAYQMNIAPDSQTTLSALIVNNVVGKNLIANAINIMAGDIRISQPIDLVRVPLSAGVTQTNKICQFRGTPAGSQAGAPGAVFGAPVTLC